MKFMAFISLLLLATCAGAKEQFFLKDDATGKVYGPYVYDHEAKVHVGSVTFTLVRKVAQDPSLVDKLRLTVLPELEFRQASVTDVVEFLKDASIEYSPAKDDSKKGVNIIMKLEPGAPVPTVTFNARHLSLIEAIKAVTRVSGLRYYIEDNIVWIESQ